MSLLKFNNYTSVDGRIIKAYDLPREEIDQLNDDELDELEY